MRSPAMSSQRCRCVVREQLLDLSRRSCGCLPDRPTAPPSGTAPCPAEQRADVGRHEAGEVEGVLHALVEGDLADVVAVVDGGHAHGVEVEHGATCTAQERAASSFSRACWPDRPARAPLRHRPADRQVAVDEVVRRGLVGDEVGLQPAGLGALDQLGQDLGGVAEQADRHRLALRGVLGDHQPPARRRGPWPACRGSACAGGSRCSDCWHSMFSDRRRRRRRQRLRAAHAAQAGGEDPAAGEVAAVVLAPASAKVS